MGLLDWIFNKENRFLGQAPDRVWLSQGEMRAHFPDDVVQAATAKTLTVVAAHFRSTLDLVRECLSKRVNLVEVTSPDEWSSAARPSPERPSPVILIHAPVLLRLGLPSVSPEIVRLKVFVFGRHFLREKDDAVEAFCERFTKPGQIGFQLSLDDPLMKIFVGENVLSLLRQMSNNEPWIESAMVSKSIVKAQEKMREKIVAQTDADSPEEWLKKNSF